MGIIFFSAPGISAPMLWPSLPALFDEGRCSLSKMVDQKFAIPWC
jgi:hypothetical protein